METVTPQIDEESCSGCGDCATACASGALDILEGKAVLVRPDDCDFCTECEAQCPQDAISCGFEVVFADSQVQR